MLPASMFPLPVVVFRAARHSAAREVMERWGELVWRAQRDRKRVGARDRRLSSQRNTSHYQSVYICLALLFKTTYN